MNTNKHAAIIMGNLIYLNTIKEVSEIKFLDDSTVGIELFFYPYLNEEKTVQQIPMFNYNGKKEIDDVKKNNNRKFERMNKIRLKLVKHVEKHYIKSQHI